MSIMNILLLLSLLATSALCKPSASPSVEPLKSGYILVEALGLIMEGSHRIAYDALAMPRSGTVGALEALERLHKLGALNFTTIKLPSSAGARAGEFVVTSINGIYAESPVTAWIASTRRSGVGGGKTTGKEEILDTINLVTTVLLPGDVLAFRLTHADEYIGLSDRLRARAKAEENEEKKKLKKEKGKGTKKAAVEKEEVKGDDDTIIDLDDKQPDL
jgi:hypothetical protein